jgi:hypothetical protein
VGAIANRRLGASIWGYILGRDTALVPRRYGSHPVEEWRVGSISVTHGSIEIQHGDNMSRVTRDITKVDGGCNSSVYLPCGTHH